MEEKIILASASPRRRELLERADILFDVIVSDSDEKYTATKPEKIVEEISRGKADDVADSCGRDNVIILAADTVVCFEDVIYGKPSDTDDAFNMLKKFQGNTHKVVTGVTFAIKKDGKIDYRTFHEATEVSVYEMTDDEIREYIATGEPMDKAGSYAIQGKYAKYIKEIKGDYSNVVGLPIGRVYHELENLKTKVD